MTVSTARHHQDKDDRRGLERRYRRRLCGDRGVPEPAGQRFHLPEVREPAAIRSPQPAREDAHPSDGSNANPAFDLGPSGTWATFRRPLGVPTVARLVPLRGRQQRLSGQGRAAPARPPAAWRRHPHHRRRPGAGRLHRLPLFHELRGPDPAIPAKHHAVDPNTCERYTYGSTTRSVGRGQRSSVPTDDSRPRP